MEEIDRYWLAGLLEGEGCFTVYRALTKKGSPVVVLRIQVGIADEDVIRQARRIIGSGTVFPATKQRKSNHSVIWKLLVSGENAGLLMEHIYPLMGSRRQRQIEEAFAERKAHEAIMSRPRFRVGTLIRS